MRTSLLVTGSASLGVGFAPSAALAHGGELFMLSAAQLLLGAVAACALAPTRISRRRKIGALAAFAVGIPLGWAAISLLPVSMVSIFLVPFAIPLCCLGLMLFVTRRRSNEQRA